ncbi:MAG TPA: nuclear transport factor 2 family protein [Chitinophagaceae bacterium]|nr:nuclear transport factor 2 family protein [Chitinophagaceae bacterium]
MKYFLFLFFILAINTAIFSQDKNENVIRKILENQNAAWNKGNLDSFMIGYWQNDSLMFIGKNGPTYGYNKTLANYKKSYPDTAHMGTFTSTIISIKKLSTNYYFVIGKWFLKRSVGDAGGVYTLLFKKINGEWKIVVDHSS